MSTARHIRAAAAGATAATVWGLLEPLDTRLFHSEYRDVALLGELVTSGRGWKAPGYALHAANGAVFGLVFDAALRRSGIGPRRLGVGLALAEHLTLYPLGIVADRKHPRRCERDVGPLWSRRVFAQRPSAMSFSASSSGRSRSGAERLDRSFQTDARAKPAS